MDEYLNNRQNEILWNLLANPANNGHLYAHNLQRLAGEFPQSALLQVMLSRSDDAHGIGHAAAYFNPKALYSIVNTPESLAMVSESQIINLTGNYKTSDDTLSAEPANDVQQESSTPAVVVAEDEKQEVEAIDHNIGSIHDVDQSEQTEDEKAGVEFANAELIEQSTELLPAENKNVTNTPIDEEPEPITITSENESFYEDELVTEAGALDQGQPTDKVEPSIQKIHGEDIKDDESLTETATFELAAPPRDIDDDVYDEIVGIEDISFAPVAKPVEEVIRSEEIPLEEEQLSSAIEEAPIVNTERTFNLDDEAERLILGNIAATDYFVFDKAVNERKQTDAVESVADVKNEPVTAEALSVVENREVSKYHDDAMPYTFMWWLSKTRKEHAGTYQPFKLDTSQAIRQRGAEELQQQYYENIFHLNAVEELDKSTSQQTVEFDLENKEDRIIKKFIVEEPHIGTPSAEKLDTENKARKSAEDQDELVTETLARIYTDQMLYHKAINTYKKLVLKFPEKSRYFADQIEQLERKTN